MTRRRRSQDETVEVVVSDPDGEPDDGAHAGARARRLRHPWRGATVVLVVVALAVAAVQWQRLGRDVDVVDAGLGWTDAPVLMCSGGGQAAVRAARPGGFERAAAPRVPGAHGDG